ncbi:MAG: flagellar basal body L-ring protein FlgH, partial [Calditrichia bacterium]
MKNWIILLTGLLAISAPAQQMAAGKSLFSDIKSEQIGKGLTVLVMEYSQASNDARTESKKQSGHNVKVAAGNGLFDFLPDINVGGNIQNDFRGDASTSK